MVKLISHGLKENSFHCVTVLLYKWSFPFFFALMELGINLHIHFLWITLLSFNGIVTKYNSGKTKISRAMPWLKIDISCWENKEMDDSYCIEWLFIMAQNCICIILYMLKIYNLFLQQYIFTTIGICKIAILHGFITFGFHIISYF